MPKKTIAVNTRFLLKNRLEGIGRFTCESLRHITQNHPEYHFAFLFDRPYGEEYIFADNITPYVLQPPARHPFLWYTWFEWSVPRALKRIQPTLFLSTDGYCSLRSNVPTVTVIHDVAFEHYGEQVPFLTRHYYQHFTPKYVAKSQRIAAVSEYTRQDLNKQYGTPLDKIDVVYNGANEQYKVLNNDEKEQVRTSYSKGLPYFYFIGAIHPRKNLANILRAFDQFKTKTNSPHLFLVAGRKAWQSQEAYTVFQNMEHQSSVIFLGHLQLSEAVKVVAAAEGLVYPSFFEGFGIPILEAMYAGVPAITANVSSMPEVAGDAALLVDPYNVDAIADAIHQLATDSTLTTRLITNGKTQQQKFSWEKTASRLWNCVEKVVAKL